jgi:hypothetical protein
LRDLTDCEPIYFYSGFPLKIRTETVVEGADNTFRREASAGNNVLVYIPCSLPDAWHPLEIRVARYLTNWIDDHGYTHTTAVLRRQIEFNEFLRDTIGIYADTVRRVARDYDVLLEPYSIKPVPVTGTMDRQTFAIPYLKLVARWEKLLRVLNLECTVRGYHYAAGHCDGRVPLLKEYDAQLDSSRHVLDEYKAALQGVPSQAHGYLGSFDDDASSYLDVDGFGGVDLIEPPVVRTVIVPEHAYAALPNHGYRSFTIYSYFPSGRDAEVEVRNQVDPSALTPEVLTRLRQLELGASQSVVAAARLVVPTHLGLRTRWVVGLEEAESTDVWISDAKSRARGNMGHVEALLHNASSDTLSVRSLTAVFLDKFGTFITARDGKCNIGVSENAATRKAVSDSFTCTALPDPVRPGRVAELKASVQLGPDAARSDGFRLYVALVAAP